MLRSLFSGVAGLKSHQTRMDTIGNNIANVNTTGFKSSRTTFADTLFQTVAGASAPTDNLGGTNPKQIGLGTGVASLDTIFTDGSVQSTGKNTDLCLGGNGLFVVKSSQGTYYTRDGAFEFDANGNYVLPGSGLYVQGWMAKNGKLTTTGGTENITIQSGKSMASAVTTTGTYSNNLNASTTGSTISSLKVTYTDGTSETVTSYTPVKTNAGITLTLSDGSIVTADAGKTYTVGSAPGAIYTSTVSSVTANGTGKTVDVAVDKGSYTAVNGNTGYTGTITGLTSGTYAKGGEYSVAKTISKVTANTDGTVLLEFNETTDGISSVTLPNPKDGTYKAGDSFTVKLNVTGGTAHAGATVTCANGQSADVTEDTAIGASFTLTDSTNTVTAITRSETAGYVYNNKQVASVSAVLSDGTSSTALSGQTYNANDTFYPSSSTTLTVYDSLGSAHTVPILFTKTAENTWGLSLTGGGTSYTLTESDGSTTTINLTSTALKFSDSGAYVSGTGSLALTYSNGAANGNVSIDLAGLTQYAGSSTIASTTDGNAAGTLKSISIDSTGTITGTYTNSVKQTEAQIAIAQFNNASGLTKTGTSLYQESNNSGTANVKTASDLGVTITPSSLEMSNVDIANEFSDMIITQRGFQSNSKIITVGDEMLETLINMKR